MSHITMMQTEAMAKPDSNHSPWRNPWVIGWVAMILVVLGMNAFMIAMAYLSSPGLVNENYYDRGQNYFKTVEQREVVANLGWDVKLDIPLEPIVGQQQTIRVTGVDRLGLPLELERIELHSFRPADASADFTRVLETEATGRYSIDVTFPLKGTWDLIVTLTQGENTHTLARRVTVAAP